jgi:glucose-6-phosphate 1-epimerase
MDLPDCVQLTHPVPDYPVYVIKHPKAKARVALHGAHLLEWTPARQKPVIYLSPQAVFEEGKPIRGGVPVCWPWFGPSLEDAQLPMHGFVRNRFWKLDSVEQDKTGVRLRFKLKDSAKTRKLWPHAFELTLEMFIGATLRLALTMKNTGDDTLFITDALHTYLCVGDVTQVSVSGLERMEYLDRVGAPVVRQQRGKVTFSQEVDRDYAARGSVVLSDGSLGRQLKIRGEGSRSTVVWNPWIEKSKRLADLPDEAYQSFVCIETANAWRDEQLLAPGAVHSLAFTLECTALDAADG